MKLVIDRKLWFRGSSRKTSKTIASALMTIDGRMCCLGFHAIACGIKKEEIDPKDSPKDKQHQYLIQYPVNLLSKKIRETLPEDMSWLIIDDRIFNEKNEAIDGTLTNSEDASRLVMTNDNTNLSDEVREKHITEIFAKHNVEVEFIN